MGVIHTSYRELSRRNSGILMAGISVVFNSLLCSIHCHKVAPCSCCQCVQPTLAHVCCNCHIQPWTLLCCLPTGSVISPSQVAPVQVIKLSDTVQAFPRSVVCCVHGAAPKFLEYGHAKSKLISGMIFSGHSLLLSAALLGCPHVHHARLPGAMVERVSS